MQCYCSGLLLVGIVVGESEHKLVSDCKAWRTQPTMFPALEQITHLDFQGTRILCALSMYFQSTASAAILHYSCWRSALHVLSSLSLTEAELYHHMPSDQTPGPPNPLPQGGTHVQTKKWE